ncbi:LysM peptidoglycan-binding domain-containing protein [Hoylesella loescheii]|uniref:LysM domain protein n=1 Tax=Hoylesella loescheii DSM 19665 = JCM 12249 = ATCC 15930 TaxID=1122985 RepID=A0A069QU94_HOYLO|nr:LysM domain-containing protein [Hoylesella loescheii]KDR53451.1 LysM domain protein [Hoylesella loescheii DSM 19665 = JCM 12249 = ATCC 15930]
MTKAIIRYLFLLFVAFLCTTAVAQNLKWRDMYQVKKKDTIFGIAKNYGLTVDELINANPEMKVAGYELKKGDYIFIPYPANTDPKAATTKAATTPQPQTVAKTTQSQPTKTIKVGVVLPLHDVDGDGKRMTEYYRGFLMGCDSLKQQGYSIDVHAWNVPADADIRPTLQDASIRNCDVIFGPLYTKQVKPLSDFCKGAGIKLVIPFSIWGDEVSRNSEIFQVYQSLDELNNASIDAFISRFGNQHPVFIDCNDSTSKKGIFTFGLRNRLNARGVKYSITNLKSNEELFSKAFSRTQPNVVVLNTGRSPELTVAIAKLKALVASNPGVVVSLFGYTEWLMYTRNNLDNFYMFNTHIPSTFYYNPLSAKTQHLENGYRRWFGLETLYALPKFALMGYDHAQFFIRGLYKYGKAFNGTKPQNVYTPLQTPLDFKRVGSGGMQNRAFMLVRYTNDKKIELINY